MPDLCPEIIKPSQSKATNRKFDKQEEAEGEKCTQFKIKNINKKRVILGHGDGLVVSVTTIYSNDPSSNPVKVKSKFCGYNFVCKIKRPKVK